jgi:CRP-like cAMP-binding protein
MQMTPRHRAFELSPLAAKVELSGYRPSHRLKSLIRKEGIQKQFDRSQKLFRKGDAASHVVLIEDGIVAITDGVQCGQRQILDFIFSDNMIAPALSPGDLNHFTAECLTSTTVSVLSLCSVERILAVEPELHQAVLDMTFAMLDGAYARLSSMVCSDGTHRIAFLLAYLYEAQVVRAPVGHRDGLPVKQVDLAAAAGLTAPHLNQIIKKMKSKGLIDTYKGRIKVIDIEGLSDFIEFEKLRLQ